MTGEAAKGWEASNLPSVENKLLRALSPGDFARLSSYLRTVRLERGAIIYEAGDEVDHVYFPVEGLLSVVLPMLSGATVETAMVGRDSGVGFVEANGSGVTSARVVVQIPGRALRVPRAAYCEAYDASKAMRTAVTGSIELLLAETRQAIACRTLHLVEHRLSWWLLEAQDRTGLDRLPLTQEFLGAMLGVQRTTVTNVARKLQAARLIHYSRGVIDILDRAGLERCACECYATVEEVRRRIELRREQAKKDNDVRR